MDDPNPQSYSTDRQVTLMQRFRSGDDAAFDEMAALYGPAIGQLVRRLLGWQGDSEDVVQDVFVAALANQRRFNGDCSLKTWLFAIAVNRCRSHHRRRVVWRRFRQQAILRHSQAAIEENRVSREESEQVRHAVGQLPAKYRDVLVLSYLEELPTAEIVQILNIRESTFYTRLHRAKKKLQEKLSNAENENER